MARRLLVLLCVLCINICCLLIDHKYRPTHLMVRNLPEDVVFIQSVQPDDPTQEWTYEKLLTVNIIPGQRLGNQLFLVSSALGLALKHGFKLVLPRSIVLYDCFDLNIPVANHIAMETVVKESYSYDSKFDPMLDRVLSRVKKNVTIIGYLQSWKYFQNVSRGTLNNYLSFQSDILERAKDLMPIGNGTTRVGIHVRRWDIVRKPHFVQFGYTTPPVGYFHRSMGYFKEKYTNVTFTVSTDDSEWVKTELLSHQNGYHVTMLNTTGESNADFIDLATLSLCDHVITSTGTYGWWAGWLSGGETIYYRNWPRKGSKLDRKVNVDDFFPREWIPME